MSTRMTAIDAQFYWMSAKFPANEFMLYAFDGVPTDFDRAIDSIRQSRQCVSKHSGSASKTARR